MHAPTSFYAGPRDLSHASAIDALMGPGRTAEDARAASPMTYVSAAFPPTLLLHGTGDRVVHHSSSQRMLEALRAVHAPADMHLFHGHDHGFEAVPSLLEQITAEAAFFLDRVLVNPDKHRREIAAHSVFAQRAAQLAR